jgi:hypothetical protein
MGVITIGTLYEPNWGGIEWSQPGGPYTTVFPKQMINVPFAAYPVAGGYPWAENSGTAPGGPAGCGHWMDMPLIFFDFNAFVVTIPYLLDSLGRVWQIGVSNGGVNITATQVGFSGNSVILLTDQITSQTWQLTAVPNGSQVDLQLTAVGGSGGQNQLLVQSPNGSLYGIQVSNGALETAYPLASGAFPAAIVTCNLCSFVQYAIPQSMFFDTFTNPATII